MLSKNSREWFVMVHVAVSICWMIQLDQMLHKCVALVEFVFFAVFFNVKIYEQELKKKFLCLRSQQK